MWVRDSLALKHDLLDYYFTLDLDQTPIEEAIKRFYTIIDNEPVHRVILYLSARSGFHIEAFTYRKVLIAFTRRKYGDDGQRLIHDLIDRLDSDVHDVLWQVKQVGPYNFKQVKIKEWHR